MTAYLMGTAVGMAVWCIYGAPWHIAVAAYVTLVTRHALRHPNPERSGLSRLGRSARRSAG